MGKKISIWVSGLKVKAKAWVYTVSGFSRIFELEGGKNEVGGNCLDWKACLSHGRTVCRGSYPVWEGAYHPFIGGIWQHPLRNITLGYLKSAFQDLDDDHLNQHLHQSNKSAIRAKIEWNTERFFVPLNKLFSVSRQRASQPTTS